MDARDAGYTDGRTGAKLNERRHFMAGHTKGGKNRREGGGRNVGRTGLTEGGQIYGKRWRRSTYMQMMGMQPSCNPFDYLNRVSKSFGLKQK